MIYELRHRHYQVWTSLAVILPILILISWLAIPNSVPVKLLQVHESNPLPVVIAVHDNPDYLVQVRTNTARSEWQLEWQTKIVSMVPSAVIYRVRDDGNEITEQELIGRIEARGGYYFPLSQVKESGKLNFVLYDFIHEKIIATIQLKIPKNNL